MSLITRHPLLVIALLGAVGGLVFLRMRAGQAQAQASIAGQQPTFAQTPGGAANASLGNPLGMGLQGLQMQLSNLGSQIAAQVRPVNQAGAPLAQPPGPVENIIRMGVNPIGDHARILTDATQPPVAS